MSVERARKFLSQFGMEDKIITFKESSATSRPASPKRFPLQGKSILF